MFNCFVRHVAWRRQFQRLAGIGIKDGTKIENKLAKYLKERHVFENADGLFDAAFFSSVAEVGAGYSNYLPNCLEALWGSIDSQHSTEADVDIRDVFAALERDSRA